MSTAPRQPDYRLKALRKSTNGRTEIGAGWENPDGSIQIKISPCVTLTDDPDITIRLFPADYQPQTSRPPAAKPGSFMGIDDEAPF